MCGGLEGPGKGLCESGKAVAWKPVEHWGSEKEAQENPGAEGIGAGALW